MRNIRLLVAAGCAGVLSFAQAAPQTVPPLPTTKPGSQAILLGVDDVRKELHLTSLQRAILDDIRNEYRDEAREVTAKVGTDAAAKKAAQAKLAALTATYDRRALRALNDEQRAKLKAIEFRILGAFMLLSADVQRQLGLTEVQKAKLAYVYHRLQKTASAINRDYEKGKISYYQRIIELRDNRIDRSDDMLERLTQKQRAKLSQLAGRDLES
jgi:Spy/CpxP family protein refolding chaperone